MSMCCVAGDDTFGGVIQTSLKHLDGSDSMQSKDALSDDYYEIGPGHFASKHGMLIKVHLVFDLMTISDLHHNNIGSYVLAMQCQHRYVGIVLGVLTGRKRFAQSRIIAIEIPTIWTTRCCLWMQIWV